MAETALVDITKMREMYDISKNYRDNRLMVQVMRAQRNDLKPFLGDALYYDFMENISDAKYQTLLLGGSYSYSGDNIYFQGVQDLVSAFAMARVLKNNDTFVAAKGNKIKTDTNSNPDPKNVTNEESREAVSEALFIQNGLDQFLDNNSSDYPLYSPEGAAQKRTGIVFIKVPPKRSGWSI